MKHVFNTRELQTLHLAHPSSHSSTTRNHPPHSSTLLLDHSARHEDAGPLDRDRLVQPHITFAPRCNPLSFVAPRADVKKGYQTQTQFKKYFKNVHLNI